MLCWRSCLVGWPVSWVSVNSEHGMPRSGVLAPSVLQEELEQISRCHTFSSVVFFTVASKEAISVTPSFRGKQCEHSMILLCKSLQLKLVANLRKTFWLKSLPMDGNWCRLGCYRLSNHFCECFEIYRRENNSADEWKVFTSSFVFQIGWLREEKDSCFPGIPYYEHLVLAFPLFHHLLSDCTLVFHHSSFCTWICSCCCDERLWRWKVSAIPLNKIKAVSWGRGCTRKEFSWGAVKPSVRCVMWITLLNSVFFQPWAESGNWHKGTLGFPVSPKDRILH